MTALRNRIVQKLTNSFIAGKCVDAHALAVDMQKEFPGVEHAELVRAICDVANGIDVRIQRGSDEAKLPDKTADHAGA